MYKILIVEDDVKLRNELSIFLKSNGYITYSIDDFSNTINSILNTKCDLILLDINLPNINGQVILKELRKQSNVPIIIVTSRNSEIDELLSINYGADDFIVKPYNTEILLARIDRTLKRVNNIDEKLMYKDMCLDISRSLIIKDNKEYDLSKNEVKILSYLLKNKDKIVSRDELMNYLWNTNEFIDDNTLTVNINRLRNKLSELGYLDVIVTKRGQGYILKWNTLVF